MKYCPQCKKNLSLEKFSNNKSRGDGKNSYCKLCQSIRMKNYRSQSHVQEKKRQYERDYIHRPHVKKHRQEYALQYYYKISPIEREQMWYKQNKKCAICKRDILTWKETRVDHCHITKKVRGLLCNDCNLLLGHAFDSLQILKAAIKYLT